MTDSLPARYPRDLRGHGRNPPHAQWPCQARVAVQFVGIDVQHRCAETAFEPPAIKILPDIGVVIECAALIDHRTAAEQIGAPRTARVDQTHEIVALAHIAGIARRREAGPQRKFLAAGSHRHSAAERVRINVEERLLHIHAVIVGRRRDFSADAVMRAELNKDAGVVAKSQIRVQQQALQNPFVVLCAAQSQTRRVEHREAPTRVTADRKRNAIGHHHVFELCAVGRFVS